MPRRFELAALFAGLGALALLCWRFGFIELGAALQRSAPRYLLVYLACGSVVRLGYALRWRRVATALGVTPGLSRFLAARLAGDATGSLLPAGRIGGDPLRVGLVYGESLSGSQASAGVGIDRIMELISNMLCTVAYVTVFSFARADNAGATLVLVVTMCLLLAALVIPVALWRRGISALEPLNRVMRMLGKGEASRWTAWSAALQRTETHVMRFFRDHPAVFIQGLVGSLAIEGLIIGEYHFLFLAFGLALDLPTLLMSLVASGLSRAVPSPAGLGALEAGQVTVLAAAAGNPAMGFAVGLVLRLHETLWTGVGLMALSLRGVGWARLRTLSAGGSAS